MSMRKIPLVRKALRRMLEGNWDATMLADSLGIKLEDFAGWMEEHRVWEQYHALLKLNRLKADQLANDHRETVVWRLLSLVSAGKQEFTDREMETVRKACVDVLRMQAVRGEVKRAVKKDRGDGGFPVLKNEEAVLAELQRQGEVKDE
ncbi:MAG: hypothetical protein WC058_05190 [Phycisphaeraceae bacterium]